MKKLAAITLAFMCAASASQAQTAGAVAGAGAQAGAQAGAAAGSTSGVILNQDLRTPGQQTITTQQRGTSTSELRNVPAVQAPSVFGGGHPCLAGQSGGIAVAGFGGSYGAGEAEVVCMLLYAGQHEAAIRALVMTNPTACKALANVGYYIVPSADGRQRVVPFNCGDTKKGGVYSASVGGPNVTSATVSTRNAAAPTAPKLFTSCRYDKAQNKLYVKYTSAGRKDKTTAAMACQRSLGM